MAPNFIRANLVNVSPKKTVTTSEDRKEDDDGYAPVKSPTTFSLCGRDFTIRQVKDPMVDCEDGLRQRVEGCIDHTKCVITLAADLTESAKKEVILHEIIHGVADALSLDFDEDTVKRLARGLRACNVEFAGEI